MTPIESWENVVCNCNDELNASSEHTDRCAVPIMRRFIAVERDEAYRKGREDACDYIRDHAKYYGMAGGFIIKPQELRAVIEQARHAGEVSKD